MHRTQGVDWARRDNDRIYQVHQDVIDRHRVRCSHAIFSITIECECGAFTTQALHCNAVEAIRRQHAKKGIKAA